MANIDAQKFAHVWQLFGYNVLDSKGLHVGTVGRIWTDNATADLKFIGIKTGLFRKQTHVIPARDEQIDDSTRTIRVAYPSATLLAAPCYNTDVCLTSEQERKVGTYYNTIRIANDG